MSSDLIRRRGFLLKAALSLAALNFGCSISRLTAGERRNTALIYATTYGATKDKARRFGKDAAHLLSKDANERMYIMQEGRAV